MPWKLLAIQYCQLWSRYVKWHCIGCQLHISVPVWHPYLNRCLLKTFYLSCILHTCVYVHFCVLCCSDWVHLHFFQCFLDDDNSSPLEDDNSSLTDSHISLSDSDSSYKVCLCVLVHVCVCVFVCISVCVCLCVYMYVCTCSGLCMAYSVHGRFNSHQLPLEKKSPLGMLPRP